MILGLISHRLFNPATPVARLTAESSLEKLAQNVLGIKRAARRRKEFLPCLAARIRALCALEKLAQNGRGIKRATPRRKEFLSCLAARIRALCALLKLLFRAQTKNGVF
jgi:hypothetical protein